jgi:toxin ParE1/3/4
MKRLIISENAYDDLLSILRFVARDKPQAAVRLVDKLQAQCEFLARFPDSGTERADLAADLRVFTHRGYGIYFRNLTDRVRIERVLPPGLDITQQSFD